MIKNIYRKMIIGCIFFLIIIPVSLIDFSNREFQKSEQPYEAEEILNTADIAGTDLYAEKINAFVAGNKSIIKQSLFTNDTNILPHFDTRDPAFYKCNLLFSASNGITPGIFPRVLDENLFLNQYQMSFNGFSGFLYYDEEITENDAKLRAERALEIIRRKFEIDLILINTSEPNFFPFVGHYPNWEIYLNELTTNLPKDGYWKVLDIDRLTSGDYLKKKHISSTFFLLNSLDFFEKDILKSIDQVNFNLDSLDLSFIYSLEVENLFEQFTDIIVDFETIFGNISQFLDGNQTISQEDFEQFSEFFNILSLSNRSHYTSVMIQYEGLEEGIIKVNKNQYQFDLGKALNYNGESLRPSEKIFINLVGAFMSEINVNILCTDIIDTTPEYFRLYDFLLEQIELILFYAGVDFDMDLVRDYSFELFWVDQGGIKQSHIQPVNLDNPTDFINFLSILGFQGISGIPTGIFNPLQEFTITYLINTSEPNIVIKKELINESASFGVFKEFSFNITAKNKGNGTCWGIPTAFPLNLDDIFNIIAYPLGESLMEDMWDIVRIEYPNQYDSLEDFFNYDEDPRIFYFDTLGLGIFDTYYPNLNNISNLWPYNSDADHVFDLLFDAYPIYLVRLDPDQVKDQFTNEYSIWNPKNWKLEPGEVISYRYSNFSINAYDSYTKFYQYNFTIDETFPNLPALISGTSLRDTNPYMALRNDEESWIIESEEKYLNQHELEVIFLFQNQTTINFHNNSLDNVSIIIDYAESLNLLDFEIFNYSIEGYQDLSPFLSSRINNTSTFSFTNINRNLDWIFDPYSPNNYTVIIKVKGMNSDVFNISINDFDVQFSYRDLNEYRGLSSRVRYSSKTGKVQYIKRSNSISLSTHNMSSIIAFSQLSNYNLKVGELNTYTLYIQNIGSNIAQDINISILIPGIIIDCANFTLKDNYLTYFLPQLGPLEKKSINFTFYTPNSESIFSTVINYKNPELIHNINSSELVARPNEVYLSAFVDYIDYFPFIHTLEFYYNSSTLAPSIGELFNLSIYIKNVGILGLNISQITLNLGDQYGDLSVTNSSQLLIFENIEYNKSKFLKVILKKEDWKGYYYPSINFFNNDDNKVFQLSSSTPIILGNITFLIQKTVNRDQIEIGDVVTITINITNIGNICIKNVTVKDIISFNQIYFELIEGSLIKKIECLMENETISISYKIKAKTQSIVILKAAKIDYYFLSKIVVNSNEIRIKIIIPVSTQFLFVFIPSIISATLVGYFLWRTHRHKVKKIELQRIELEIFLGGSRETILKKKHTLREYLNDLKKDTDKVGGGLKT